MSALTTNDYIKSIICFLKDESQITESKLNEEKKEFELDLSSESLFENLYHNLLFYYKLYKNKILKLKNKNIYSKK